MSNKELIRRLTYARKQAGFNQKELCKELGVNTSYISRLETKQDFLPSWDIFFKMLQLCNVSEEVFFSKDYGREAEKQEELESFENDYHIQATAYAVLKESLSARQKELVRVLLGGML